MAANSTKISKLSNGLTVITSPMPTTNTAAIGFWINVGTRHEPENASGVAHLVEHMLFKGTNQRTAFEISAEIEDVGGQMNAYTSREQTAYYVKVLPDDVKLALDIIADMLKDSLIDEEELEREREVIVQEISQTYDQADELLQDMLHEAIYPGQQFGKPILGNADLISEMERPALIDYIKSHYGANNITLVATGAIDEDEVLKLAEDYCGSLPTSATPDLTTPTFKPAQVKIDKDLEQVNILLAWPGVSYTHDDMCAFATLAQALGGGSSSRLFNEVREKRGLVYTIWAMSTNFLDTGTFHVFASATDDNCDEVLDITAREMKSFAETVTQEEVDRAKAQLKAGIIMGLEGPLAHAEHIGHQYQIHGRVVTMEELVEKHDAVTLEDVKRVARQLLASPMATGLIGPQKIIDNLPNFSDKLAA